jgi:hypothetical protein
MREALAIVLLLLVVAWCRGSFALHAVGLLLVLVGLPSIVASGAPGVGTAGVLLRVVAWLAGHWRFWRREYRSALPERVCLQALPFRLDPTRNWTEPSGDEPARWDVPAGPP